MAGFLRVWLVLAAAVSLVGCERDVHDYKYRLTLEVNDNGRVYTGSSVVMVHQGKSETIDDGYLLRTHSRGEATVVKLGNGRVLCALLHGPSIQVHDFSQPAWNDGPSVVLIEAYGLPVHDYERSLSEVVGLRGAREIALDRLPALAASTDPADPQSFQFVDPNNLAPALGDGVRLQRATVEVTDDPITNGITRTVPWLTHPPHTFYGSHPMSGDFVD